MHESIIEHFLNLKLQSAVQLMLSSDMNFSEIAELLSFSSVGYFSKFFKKRTGMTPTEYSKEYGLR
jgi:AraC-like DNA-binding protein